MDPSIMLDNSKSTSAVTISYPLTTTREFPPMPLTSASTALDPLAVFNDILLAGNKETPITSQPTTPKSATPTIDPSASRVFVVTAAIVNPPSSNHGLSPKSYNSRSGIISTINFLLTGILRFFWWGNEVYFVCFFPSDDR